MRELVDALNRYAHAYYVMAAPLVSDGQYDALYDELTTLEERSGVVLDDSPSRRVGAAPVEGFLPHAHIARLWSLEKCKTEQELLAWEQRTARLLAQSGLPAPGYLLEYKIDGLTINLTYREGLLVQAATRGDGVVGEGILPQVKTIRSIPLRVPYTGTFEVQGEGYMPLSALEAYNQSADEPLKNARNAAAGALRNLDPKMTERRNLDAFFYQIGYIEGASFDTATDMRHFLEENGFRVAPLLGRFDSARAAYSAAMALDERRRREDFLTDGMVLKIDESATRDALGATDRFPRWAIAIKFEAQEAVTVLRDVVWDVGRTGKLTPTALLDPVELAGATVSRATLNNPGDIARKRVRKGGAVWIRRSNDVIPEILGSADDNGDEIVIPARCPACDTPVEARGAHLFCPNRERCKPQRLYALCHFTSRAAMDIQGLSERTLTQAMDAFGVVTADELYDISVEQWRSLDGFAQRRAEKVFDALERSKKRPLPRFIYALGIPNVGRRTAQALSEAFGTLDALMRADEQALFGVRDVGPIVARSIVEFFNDEEQRRVIARLKDHGVLPEEAQEEAADEGLLSGERIVFTGTLVRMGRKQAQALAASLGAEVSESVTKQTTMLVAGEKAGSKLERARSLGARVLSEDEFFETIGVDGV